MSIKKRLNGITKIPLSHLSAIAPEPKSIKIELTPKCNYRCQYCAICFRNEEELNDMSFELFEKITTQASKAGVQEIGLFYIGEPFMSFDLLMRCLVFVKGVLKIPYVFLTSNASLAIPGNVKELMSAGLDSLKWSCNTADVEQFKELICVPEKNFYNALENIKMAYAVREAFGYKTRLYASRVKYNEEQLARMKPLLDEKIIPYVDEHYWLPLYTAGGQAREKEKSLGMKPNAGNTGRLDDPSEPIPCWTLFTSAHVRANGDLTACCLDGTGYWKMCNLNEQDFMQAWNSDDFMKLRKAHLDKNIVGTKCTKCALY